MKLLDENHKLLGEFTNDEELSALLLKNLSENIKTKMLGTTKNAQEFFEDTEAHVAWAIYLEEFINCNFNIIR